VVKAGWNLTDDCGDYANRKRITIRCIDAKAAPAEIGDQRIGDATVTQASGSVTVKRSSG
jgi:carbonic anhydrase